MKAIFTAEVTARFERAIREVETNTAGEIVIVVNAASDDYAGPRALAAVVVSVALAMVLQLALPHITRHFWLVLQPEMISPLWVLAAQIPLGIVGWRLAGSPAILRRLVRDADENAAVLLAAQAAFVAFGVTETRDRSGVLIYLSLLERRVQILADRGIHQRLGESTWQQHADAIAQEVCGGQAERGLTTAIQAIGAALAEHFPRRPDDKNELSDRVIVVGN